MFKMNCGHGILAAVIFSFGVSRAEITTTGVISPSDTGSWTSSTSFYVGTWNGDGSLAITGPSSLTSKGGYVGYYNYGSIDITGGGSFTSYGAVDIGRENYGGWGEVLISGTDSSWTVTGSMTLGAYKCDSTKLNKLTVSAGGDLNVGGGTTGIIVGSVGSGHLTVTGAGSTLSTTTFNAGYSSSISGIVDILDGAAMYTEVMSIGKNTITSSQAVLTIDDSQVRVYPYQLDIGSSSGACGEVYVSNGARLMINETRYGWGSNINIQPGSLLSIEVDGNNVVTLGDRLRNFGTVSLTAAPGLDPGTYSPIYARQGWEGSGEFTAVGGTWDSNNHNFIVGDPVTTDLGVAADVDLSAN